DGEVVAQALRTDQRRHNEVLVRRVDGDERAGARGRTGNELPTLPAVVPNVPASQRERPLRPPEPEESAAEVVVELRDEPLPVRAVRLSRVEPGEGPEAALVEGAVVVGPADGVGAG